MSAHRASPPSNMASTHSYLPPPSLQSTKLLSLHSLQFEYNHWIRQPSGYNGCVDTSRTYKYNPLDVLWMLCGLQSPFSFVQGQNVCCTPELCCKCDMRPAEAQFNRGFVQGVTIVKRLQSSCNEDYFLPDYVMATCLTVTCPQLTNPEAAPTSLFPAPALTDSSQLHQKCPPRKGPL